MAHLLDPTGERSNHKVAAAIASKREAVAVRHELLDRMALDSEQLAVIHPAEAQVGRSLLPDSDGIWRTILRSHVVLGLFGVVAGAVLFLSLHIAGVPFVRANPLFGALALIHVSFLISLLVAGMLVLRPDQLPLIGMARGSLRDGQAVLIAHARSTDEMNTLRAELHHSGLPTAQTL